MFAKLARNAAPKLAAVTATTAGVAVAQTPAHARAPPSQRLFNPAAATGSVNKEDGWLLPLLNDGEVLFKGEELQEGVEELRAIVTRYPHGAASAADNESATSDGEDANDIIELADRPSSAEDRHLSVTSTQVEALLAVAQELLKRPNVQHEVVDVIRCNSELMKLLGDAGRGELQLLLPRAANAAITAPPPTITEVVVEEEDEPAAAAVPGSLDPMSQLLMVLGDALKAAAAKVERTGTAIGTALGRLGNWLKHSVMAALQSANLAPKDEAGTEGEQAGARPSIAQRVVGGVTLVAVAIVVLMLVKRPGVLVRVATATAAAGAARQQSRRS